MYTLMLIQSGGFPYDFSILVAFRLTQNVEGNLLTIYNDAGIEQLALIIGENITFMIVDNREDDENRKLLTAKFLSRVNDGKWHRLALSVKVN